MPWLRGVGEGCRRPHGGESLDSPERTGATAAASAGTASPRIGRQEYQLAIGVMPRRTAHRLRERVLAMETVFPTATGVHILATVSDARLDASVVSR